MTIRTGLLTATRFTLAIPGEEYKDIIANVVDFNHPAVRSPFATQPTRQVDIPRPGSKMVFDPLVVRVQLDNDMKIYQEVYNWIFKNATSEDEDYRDLTLTIYNMNENPQKAIRYLNAFPTDLGLLSFTSTDQNDTIINLDVTFGYSHFELVSV